MIDPNNVDLPDGQLNATEQQQLTPEEQVLAILNPENSGNNEGDDGGGSGSSSGGDDGGSAGSGTDQTPTEENNQEPGGDANAPEPEQNVQNNTQSQSAITPEDLAKLQEALANGFNEAKKRAEQQQQTEQPPLPQEPPQQPPAFADNDAFLEAFNTDAQGAIVKLAESMAEKKASAIVEERMKEFAPLAKIAEQEKRRGDSQNAFSQFLNNNPQYTDVQSLFPAMADVMRSGNLPPTDPHSYDKSYLTVKNQGLANQLSEMEGKLQGAKTLDQYMADPESLDKIIDNESVYKAAVERYLAGLREGGKPAVIGTGTTGPGIAPAIPPNRPDDWASTQRMAESYLRGN